MKVLAWYTDIWHQKHKYPWIHILYKNLLFVEYSVDIPKWNQTNVIPVEHWFVTCNGGANQGSLHANHDNIRGVCNCTPDDTGHWARSHFDPQRVVCRVISSPCLLLYQRSRGFLATRVKACDQPMSIKFFRVDMPNSTTYLNQTPIFEWYVVRCGSKNIYHSRLNMCIEEIGLMCSKFDNHPSVNS